MIVRHLAPEDRLEPPMWPLGDLRPSAMSLVAVEDAKIVGLCWLADGGSAALFVLGMWATPKAVWTLYNAMKRLAKTNGHATIVSSVEAGRLENVLRKRGWIVAPQITYPVAVAVNGG